MSRLAALGLGLGLALSASTAAAKEPIVELALEPRSVTVGDPVVVSVTVRLPSGDAREPRFPEASELSPELESLEEPVASRSPTASGNEWIQSYRVAAYRTGTIAIPAIEIRLSGEPETVVRSSDSVTLEVRSILPADLEGVEPRPPAPPVPIAAAASFYWTAALLAILAVCLAVFAFTRRRRTIVARPDLPPAAELEAALARLAGLEPNIALAALSLALRRYLGRSFDLRAVEATTSELAIRLGGAGLDGQLVRRAIRLFRDIDQIKFARRSAGATEASRACSDARALVAEIETHLHPVVGESAA